MTTRMRSVVPQHDGDAPRRIVALRVVILNEAKDPRWRSEWIVVV